MLLSCRLWIFGGGGGGGWGILNILVRLRVMKANAVLSINFSFANVQQNSYPLPLFCIV